MNLAEILGVAFVAAIFLLIETSMICEAVKDVAKMRYN